MKDIIKNFKIKGKLIKISEVKNGLVNKTYLIKTNKALYLLQKINHYVFKNPDKLMHNINIVTKHLNKKRTRTLEIIKTIDNKLYYYDDVNYYRIYKYIVDLKNVEVINNKTVLEVGKTIGKFQLELMDLNHDLLFETIPNFHNFISRINDLIKSYEKCNFYDIRKFKGTKYYNYIISNSQKNMLIQEKIKKGDIPLRITHNDTKLNNILFDKLNNLGVCLIDLDTVMPGSILFDYADACRSSIVTVDENSLDIDNIDLDDSKFVSLTIGYLSKIKDRLTKEETNLLVDAIGTIVIECATRFLTDYFNHDIYFKIDYEEQNLDRAINQLKLYECFLKKEEYYKSLVKIILRRLNAFI